MSQDPFAPGVQVVHIKMQVLGKVVKVVDDLVHVKVVETMPIQIWSKQDLRVWDGRAEIQKKLKQGGKIRDIFKKFEP